MKASLIIFVCGATSLGWSRVAAKDPAEAVPDQLDISKFPASVVEDVFVPVPSEIFSVLDKLGEPDWRGELRRGGYGTLADRTKIALIFGIAVADGFLAVEAEDRDAIQRTGREVLRLANAIGIQESVTPHVQSIIEAAQHENWQKVRGELDRTQATVRATMEKMRDDDLARCVSIGGWLRGTQVVSALISDSYSSDKAELLSQPEIVEHFGETIMQMQPAIKNHESVKELIKGLDVIHGLMEESENVIGADVVVEINEVCSMLLESIGTQNKSGSGKS